MMLIRSVQIELNNMGAVIKALPHLARPSDRTAKEVLSFICIMLFNANEEIQVHIRCFHIRVQWRKCRRKHCVFDGVFYAELLSNLFLSLFYVILAYMYI